MKENSGLKMAAMMAMAQAMNPSEEFKIENPYKDLDYRRATGYRSGSTSKGFNGRYYAKRIKRNRMRNRMARKSRQINRKH